MTAIDFTLTKPIDGQPLADATWSNMATQWQGDGVLSGGGECITQPQGGNMNVSVTPGQTFALGYYGETAGGILAIPFNTNPSVRYDLIAARLDIGQKKFILMNIDGSAGSGAPPAPLRSAAYWDIPLAVITVASGTGSIVGPNVQLVQPWASGARAPKVYTVNAAATIQLPAGNNLIIPIAGTTAITAINPYPSQSFTPRERVLLVFGSPGCHVRPSTSLRINGDFASSTALSPWIWHTSTLALVWDNDTSQWIETARSWIPPCAAIYNTGSQGFLNNGGNYPVVYNAPRYNSDGMYPGGGTNYLTIQTAGEYQLSAHAEITVNTAGTRLLSLQVNGARIADQAQNGITGGVISGRLAVSRTWRCAVGDQVGAQIYVDQANLNLLATGPYSNDLVAQWVGP